MSDLNWRRVDLYRLIFLKEEMEWKILDTFLARLSNSVHFVGISHTSTTDQELRECRDSWNVTSAPLASYGKLFVGSLSEI